MHPDVSLTLYEPLNKGGAEIGTLHDLDPDITSLRTTSTDPGGWAGLDCGLDPARPLPVLSFLPVPGEVPLFAHVQLVVAGEPAWEGRVMRRRWRGGAVRGFTAMGYGITATKDKVYTSTDTTSATAGTILWEVLASCAPLLRLRTGDSWQDPGTLHARADFNGMYPAAIIDQLVKQGGSGDVRWAFRVYRDRLVYFGPETSGVTEARYRLLYDDTVEWDEDAEQMYGSAYVSYSDGGVAFDTAVADNPDFEAQWGIERTTARNVGDMTANAAAQARDTLLANSATPKVAAKFQRTSWEPVPGPAGPTPPYLLQAGEPAQVGDLPVQRLTTVAFDWRTGNLGVTLGEPPVDDARAQLARQRENGRRADQDLHNNGGRLPRMRQQAAVAAVADSTGGAVDGALEDVRGVALTNTTTVGTLTVPAALTDSSGGAANNTVQAISAAYVQAEVANNFADVTAKINAVRAQLTTTNTAIGTVNTNFGKVDMFNSETRAALILVNNNIADLAASLEEIRSALRGANLLP